MTSPDLTLTEQLLIDDKVTLIDQSIVKNCMATECGAEFTMVIRKHHCRGCGKVFCGKCSKKVKRKDQNLVSTSKRLCSCCRLSTADSTSTTTNVDVSEEVNNEGEY